MVRNMILATIAGQIGVTAAAVGIRWMDHNRSDKEDKALPSIPDGQKKDGVFSKDGTHIYVDYVGDADPTIFFFHGWACNGTIWHRQKARFSENYRGFSSDMRGHGRSDIPKSLDYHPDRLAEDLKAVIDAFNPQEFIIVAHSLGGFSTYKFHEYFGEEYSGRLKGFVSIDSSRIDVAEGLVMGGIVKLFYPGLMDIFFNIFGRELGRASCRERV